VGVSVGSLPTAEIANPLLFFLSGRHCRSARVVFVVFFGTTNRQNAMAGQNASVKTCDKSDSLPRMERERVQEVF
jgi:hypothetical protein